MLETSSPTGTSSLMSYWNQYGSQAGAGMYPQMTSYRVNSDGTVTYSLSTGQTYTKSPQDFNSMVRTMAAYTQQVAPGTPGYTGAYLPTNVAGASYGGSEGAWSPTAYRSGTTAPAGGGGAAPVVSATGSPSTMGPIALAPGDTSWLPSNPRTGTGGSLPSGTTYLPGGSIYGRYADIPGSPSSSQGNVVYPYEGPVWTAGRYGDPAYAGTLPATNPRTVSVRQLQQDVAGGRMPAEESTVPPPDTSGPQGRTGVVYWPGGVDIPGGGGGGGAPSTTPTTPPPPQPPAGTAPRPRYGRDTLGMPEGTRGPLNPLSPGAIAGRTGYGNVMGLVSASGRGGATAPVSVTDLIKPPATNASAYVPGAAIRAAAAQEVKPRSWLQPGVGYGDPGYGGTGGSTIWNHPTYFNEAGRPYHSGEDTTAYWFNPSERIFYQGSVPSGEIKPATGKLPWMTQPYQSQTGNQYTYFNATGKPFGPGDKDSYWYNRAEGTWYHGDLTGKIDKQQPPWL